MKLPVEVLAAALLLSASLRAEDLEKPATPPRKGESVIIFLLDNSASLPPLDPDLQRTEAIEKISFFPEGAAVSAHTLRRP